MRWGALGAAGSLTVGVLEAVKGDLGGVVFAAGLAAVAVAVILLGARERQP